MRLSVASTGGAAGSWSAGDAARFKAMYSVTGSTTQPSAADVAVCAKLATPAATSRKSASVMRDARKRIRFMGKNLLCNFVCSLAGTRLDKAALVAATNQPHFGSKRDRGVISR